MRSRYPQKMIELLALVLASGGFIEKRVVEHRIAFRPSCSDFISTPLGISHPGHQRRNRPAQQASDHVPVLCQNSALL